MRRNLRLALAASLATLLCCEIGLRLYDAARGRTMNARAFWYWLYEQDPYLGWRGRPRAHVATGLDDIRHDDAGFWDARDLAPLLHREPGVRLVVCVGESSTYGLSAGSIDATYPAVLERELRALSGSDRWVVFDAGMPGYTSHEILELVNLRLLKLEPEILLDMNLANDHDFMTKFIDDGIDYDRLPIRLAQLSRTPLRDLLMRSSLFASVSSRLIWRTGDDLGSVVPDESIVRSTPRGLKLYRDDLAMTALLARRSGVRLMLVDQPIDESAMDAARVADFARVRAVLADTCREEGIPCLAAQAVFDWTGLTIRQEVHLGREGYARLAKLLAPQVLREAGAAPVR